jgi:hypothetical protein
MHELLRQYAEDQLDVFPREKEAFHELHSRYYVEFLSERMPSLTGKTFKETKHEIRADIENVRAAIHWAVAHWDEERARSALASYHDFYATQGWHEGQDAFKRVVRVAQERFGIWTGCEKTKSSLQLSCLVYQAVFYSYLGDTEASQEISLNCLPALRELGIREELGVQLFALGINAVHSGDFEKSKRYLEEAISIGKEIRHEKLIGASLIWLGYANY